jgi:hypothetical protein
VDKITPSKRRKLKRKARQIAKKERQRVWAIANANRPKFIPKLKKVKGPIDHSAHVVEIWRRPDICHYAEIHCIDCDKHIQWLSQTQYEFLIKEQK